MSLYFFALDCMRVVGKDQVLEKEWPNPTINELHDALEKFCSLPWKRLEDATDTLHTYTDTQTLPHRCLEVVYMTVLLRDGYGIDPSSRGITYAFDVGGLEVEWTLGLVLTLHAADHESVNFLESTKSLIEPLDVSVSEVEMGGVQGTDGVQL
mmetsp:Transcript_21664/g.49277  ORF Transcript_21664/g.49277 Transcript_21664/m.49277 type:complete len:153 (+) Transcript_21664:1092-1550(+)